MFDTSDAEQNQKNFNWLMSALYCGEDEDKQHLKKLLFFKFGDVASDGFRLHAMLFERCPYETENPKTEEKIRFNLNVPNQEIVVDELLGKSATLAESKAMTLNVQYLKDALLPFTGEKVSILVTGKKEPLYIFDEYHVAIIAPMDVDAIEYPYSEEKEEK